MGITRGCNIQFRIMSLSLDDDYDLEAESIAYGNKDIATTRRG